MDIHISVSFYIGISVLFTVAYGDDFCQVGGNYEYCTYGCCDLAGSTTCCLSPYTIAGIVFGCISVICAIAAIIFCLCKKKQQNGRVMHVAQQQPHVLVVSNSNTSHSQSHAQPYNQPYGYSQPYGQPSTQPLPPGYASTYNNTYPSGQPPFGNAAPPPPAYTYSEPSNNPFAAAAHAREATNNSVHIKKR